MIKFNNENLDARTAILKDFFSNNKDVEVTFRKVDGEIRTMPCTLQDIPTVVKENTDKKTKKPNPEVMSVFCTDKQEWRSFKVNNVISITALGD
jgi:hypothetical protein